MAISVSTLTCGQPVLILQSFHSTLLCTKKICVGKLASIDDKLFIE